MVSFITTDDTDIDVDGYGGDHVPFDVTFKFDQTTPEFNLYEFDVFLPSVSCFKMGLTKDYDPEESNFMTWAWNLIRKSLEVLLKS